MKLLWSPWRMKYIQRPKHTAGCFLCEAAKDLPTAENLVIAKGETAFVLLNRYPYNNGHLMVAPFAHIATHEDLTQVCRLEIMDLLAHATAALRSVYAPEGYNIGANLGAASGAGVADHLHFHIVPRWVGDSSFMSTVGEVRVRPEELEATWRRLREVW